MNELGEHDVIERDMGQHHKDKHDLGDADYGTLILLVGPSGSGKDSVLNYAREALKDDPRMLFVRRCITRSNGDPSEDHESMSVAAFQKAEMEGRFVISWGAHGLYYGLPKSLLAHLETGGVVIANGSRKTIPLLRDQFHHFHAINLTVEPETLIKRLSERGRENSEEIRLRIERTKKLESEDLFDEETIHLDNSGEIGAAGKVFVDMLRKWAENPE